MHFPVDQPSIYAGQEQKLLDMEVTRVLIFVTGVALVSGQCDESKMEQCLNQTNGVFTNNNGIQDITNLCSESTKTAFLCFKSEINKCMSSSSFTEKEALSFLNRITAEGLQKVCNIFSNMAPGSYPCFSKAIENSVSSIQACIQSDSAFANAKANTATLVCRTFDLTYKCGLERVRNDCPTYADDFRSWRDAMQTLFACEDSGNSSNRYNSAPTFLLIAFGVQMFVAVGL
ncbi:hypothetical protein ACJMK2_019181 [Sinanodonta woodiana]|uniref:Secreted protein n=1 Tax=Sinanodonta woodiana TaxID=1069815 RepID=A0ABD3UJN0_SINWO